MIIINKNSRITFQKLSIDLEEQKKVVNKATGETSLQWSKASYHSTILGALNQAFKESLINKKDIVQLKDADKYLKEQMNNFIKSLKIEDQN